MSGPEEAQGQDPTQEENFPRRSPTRDAVEREMAEPGNVRGSGRAVPRKRPPTYEAGAGEDAGP